MTTSDPNVYRGLVGLIPLVVYIILIFRYKKPVPLTILGAVLGAVITHQTIFSFADILAKSLGSFLALVGLLIMLGRGLGEVLTATKITHTLVHKIIYTIGVNTQNRAIIGIMAASVTIVALLGTMAGGNAVIAPIVLPVAASAGLTRSTVGVLFHACGEEALILGPFSPSVLMLLGLTHLAYSEMLLKCALPVLSVTFLTTWFMVKHIQRHTKGVYDYEEQPELQTFVPDSKAKRATLIFLGAFASFVGFGLYWHANTNYIVVIIMILALLAGLAGGLNPFRVTETFVKGMAGNLHLFVLFLFLEPFINFMDQAGAFKAVTALLTPLVNYGGKAFVPIIGGLTGTVGLTGAAVAVLKMTNDLFINLVQQYQIPIFVWGTALVVANRATNFVHPGSNMFSSMGFANSDDLKSMIKNGWTVAFMQLSFLCVYSVIFT
jgi:H+/gluconate symporter-like permease